MNEAYTKFMLQQDLSADADAAFYEKLENGTQKKRIPAWKVAVVAACICLIIPGCVWAAETIFGVTKVTKSERPTLNDNPGIGLDIVYENIQYYPLKNFPQHLQELEDGGEILHDSWADAETYLGIDLIDNPLFTAEDTRQMAAWGEPGKYCHVLNYVFDKEFSGSRIGTAFQRDNTEFVVSALIMAESAAEYDDIVTKYYHGSSITYQQYPIREVSIETEQYVTKAGIPVLLVSVTREPRSNEKYEDLYECKAYFAVNNISYRVGISGWSFGSEDIDTFTGPKEKLTAAMLEVLDGFVIE